VLNTGKDFFIIDLEGDLALPLSDRRRKHSPLVDVASMIHSLQSCTTVALHQGRVRPEDVVNLGPWVDFWGFGTSVAFLRAYLQAADGASFLPQVREEVNLLLHYYLIRRAVIDLRNELTNRPERAQVQLQVLADLVEGIQEASRP